MCLACLGFMLVLVLLRIAGVPLGTPFSDPKYENKAQQGRKVWIAGTIETYEKKSSNNGYVLRGEGSKGKIYLLAKRGDLPVGAAVRVYGTVKKPESPRNPGMFDEKTYYEGKGCAFYVISEREEVVDVGRWNLGEALRLERERCCAVLKEMMPEEEAGVLSAMLLGERSELTEETYLAYQQSGLLHLISVSGVKTLKLDIPLVPETSINWAFVPLHIAIIYILKLCLDEEIIPRCRFPCSRGYFKKCINWQNKKSFSVSQSYRKSLKNQQKEKKPMAYKKYREMKVYEASGYQYKRTPSIVLKGQWLSELGFDIGDQIEVKCEDGRLIITKANEIWQCE